MTAVPELRGDGIILNAHNDSEAAAHAAGGDEETARRFGWWPEHSTEETVRRAYATWARSWQDDGPIRAFAARNPGSGALVGGCELRIGPDGTGEVSYWTHAGQRGRGYARNALALLVGYAASIGITRLEAHVALDNHASRRTAEAAGFAQASTFTDDDGTEMICYHAMPPVTGQPLHEIRARSEWLYSREEAVDLSTARGRETIKAAAADEGKTVSAWVAEAAMEKARAAALHAAGRAAAHELIAEYEGEHGPLPAASREHARRFLVEAGLIDNEAQRAARSCPPSSTTPARCWPRNGTT